MTPNPPIRSVLVFGASGAVGRFLVPLLSTSHEVIPSSRQTLPGWPTIDLSKSSPSWPDADAIVNLGPIDVFASNFAACAPAATRRVIAFSSMSAESKRNSEDSSEHQLAARLRESETQLRARCEERGVHWTIFRPTLIYGAGVDRNLAPIARFARKWRFLPIPVGATGLRQPVHARDLASACIASLDNAITFNKVYELGGGERLSFGAMLHRLRRAIPARTANIPVPLSALRLVATITHDKFFSRGAINRLRLPLIADNSPAERDFGYAPRAFAAEDVLPESTL